jgi:hypothetical protein
LVARCKEKCGRTEPRDDNKEEEEEEEEEDA